MGKRARLESAAVAHPEVLWLNPVGAAVAVRRHRETALLTAAHCHLATLLATGDGHAIGEVTSRLCVRHDLDLALYRVRWAVEPPVAVVAETAVSVGDRVRWVRFGGGRKSSAIGRVVLARCSAARDRRRFGGDDVDDLWAGVVENGTVCRLDSGGGVFRIAASDDDTEELVGIISRMMSGPDGNRHQHDDRCSVGQLVATVTRAKIESLFACAP